MVEDPPPKPVKRPRPADILADVGQRLKEARMLLDPNRTRFARHFGVHHGLWAKWESGEHYPDPYVMTRLCAEYGLTMEYLYRGVLAHMPNEELKIALARKLPPKLVAGPGVVAPVDTSAKAAAGDHPASADSSAASGKRGKAKAPAEK